MYITRRDAVIAVFAILGLGLVGGWSLGTVKTPTALADTECTVDQATLAQLYDAVFHRPLDAGASFHVGKPLSVVLESFAESPEHAQYTGLFTAMKALEEARRAPADVSSDNMDKYKKIIDLALSVIASWADTLPQQALENRVVGPDQARASILRAYNNLSPDTQATADYGLFNAMERIGPPSNLSMPAVPPQATPTPSASPTPTPSES